MSVGKMKYRYVKSVFQTSLTDEHLKANVLVECSNSKANIDDSVKAKRHFHKSLSA